MIDVKNAPSGRLLAGAMLAIVAVHLVIASRASLGNDGTMQWAQIVAGRLNDWHPPAMTRLWQALSVFGPGPLPIAVFSVLLYWAGFLSVAAAFLRQRQAMATLATIAIGLFGAVLWFEPISKDTLLTAFFVLGYGVALHARLMRRPSGWLLALAAALFLCGVLMRHNGAFAAGPALLFAIAPGILRRFWPGLALSVVLAVLLVPVSQIADRHLFGAGPSRVEDSLMLFDLSGIASASGDLTVFGASTPITRRDLSLCYTPVMWDRIAPWGICPWFPGKAGAPLLDQPELIAGRTPPPSDFKGKWIAAVARHPLAYLEHRLRHVNAELLLFVSTKPRNGVVPNDPVNPAEPLTLTVARYTAGVVFIPAVVVSLAVAAFLILSARNARPGGPLLSAAYSMSCSALLYAGAYAVLGVATAPRYYMLTGVLALIALAAAACDPGVRTLWRARPRLRAVCMALPLLAVGVAELGRVVVPIPPSMPLIPEQ